MSAAGRLHRALRAPDGVWRPPLRGTVGRVIRVRDPVPGLFREALFLLDEAQAGEGVDQKALLRQAREAALSYSAEYRARRSLSPLFLAGSHVLCLALGALLGRLLL